MSDPSPLKIRIAHVPDADSLVVRVELANDGPAVLVLNQRNAVGEPPVPGQLPTSLPAEQRYEFAFSIVEMGGESLPFVVDVKAVPLEGEHFREVDPYDKVGREISLSSYYAVERGKRYQVQCAYLNAEDGRKFGVNAWTGIVASNVLSELAIGN